jgi:hypothetical protein
VAGRLGIKKSERKADKSENTEKWGKDLINIAVYSEDVMSLNEMVKWCNSSFEVEKKEVSVISYNVAGDLEWDMENPVYDVVVVHGNWRLAQSIRDKSENVNMIMVSDGANGLIYDIEPCFLVYEPVRYVDFSKILKKSVAGFERETYFTFKQGRANYRVKLSQIMYFENDRRLVKIVCEDESFSYYGKLSEVEDYLEACSSGFVRVHGSFIINLDFVKVYGKDFVILQDDTYICVSGSRRTQVRSVLAEYVKKSDAMEKSRNIL